MATIDLIVAVDFSPAPVKAKPAKPAKRKLKARKPVKKTTKGKQR